MGTYTTLWQGNSNTAENKKLQKLLKDVGYGSYLGDYGDGGVDGKYGQSTYNAVEAFQKDYNLQVDGKAGDETWGKLIEVYNSQNQQPAQQATAPTVAAEPEKVYQYVKEEDSDWVAADQKVKDLEGSRPTIKGTYDEQVNQLYEQVMGQKNFEYDLNGDALWQQYKDQYTTQGKLAMMDAMGQAAALTGGYGSSYAQGVGQQAYQGYLQQLNDRVPELYQLALQKYNSDQALLKDKFTTAKGMQDDEYSKHMDETDLWYKDLGLAKDDLQTAYEQGSSEWYTGEQLRREDEETEYTKQQNAYSNLANMIASTGYVPTDAELQAAGMSAGEANALRNEYNRQVAASYKSKNSDPEYIVPEEGGYEEKTFYHLYETAGEQAAVDFADGLGVHPAVIGVWVSDMNPDQWLFDGA